MVTLLTEFASAGTRGLSKGNQHQGTAKARAGHRKDMNPKPAAVYYCICIYGNSVSFASGDTSFSGISSGSANSSIMTLMW